MSTNALRASVAALFLLLSPAVAVGQTPPPSAPPQAPPAIPPVTEEDRRAAFPDVKGHSVHDNALNYFVLFDQLEGHAGHGHEGISWDTKGWIGRDLDRFLVRSEGLREGGDFRHADVQLMYGRGIARWWDLVVGVRQDLRPTPGRTWAAFGVQGLAPYWFDVEATAYIGQGGRTLVRFEAEYDLLMTNRLKIQPLVEVDLYSQGDAEHGIGSGLSRGEFGLRVRYEIKREFAPYVGVSWDRKYFGTAAAARAAGDSTGGVRFVAGVRWWR
jgi:copper resistance protein B